MNHYPRHLGDYTTGTLGFNQGEHGAYGLLMDAYYASEAPLLAEDVYAIGKATNAAERKAVDKVLARKFELRDGHYYHERIEAELEAYRQRVEAARHNGKQPKRKQVGKPERSGIEAKYKQVASIPLSVIEAESKLASSHKPLKQPQEKQRLGDSSTVAPEMPQRAFPPPGDSRVKAMQELCDGHELQAPLLALRQWVADGVTEEILRAALDRGRQRKNGAPMNLAFLQLMVQDVRAAGVGYDSAAVIAETIAAINAKEAGNAAY